MTLNMDSIYNLLRLKLRKQEEQKRFNFLKALEGSYPQKDFSIQDPFGFQHHPYVKKEQLKWVEKMGVGSYHSRFQVEHLELQNALVHRFTPKAFFSQFSIADICDEIHKWIPRKQKEHLTSLFEEDPLGLLPLGFETHLKAPLVRTCLKPFAHFYLVEDPLHTLLYENTPQSLLPPYLLAAMHTCLDLLPTMQKERKDVLEKTLLLFDNIKDLGFDLTLQKCLVHINTSKKQTYKKELEELGWILQETSHGLALNIRIDHEESTLFQFVQDMKKIQSKKTAVIC